MMAAPEQSPAHKPVELKVSRLTGLKKRQQIEVAGHMMFIWVAIAAVAVSFCVATGQFLFTKWDYNNKILDKKYTTSQTLANNIVNAQKLKEEVDKLTASQELASIKTNPEDSNTKSVLDALPTAFDPTALATSLQQVVLSRSGVSIESISVPPDVDVSAGQATAGTKGVQEIKFGFVVTGTYDKIKQLMIDLDRTVRPMKLTNLALTGSDANLRASFDFVTYYQPAQTIKVSEELVK
jgi:hypothetical protein